MGALSPVPVQRIEVPPHPPAETIETQGCSIVLRRVEGPEARELFFGCRPPAEVAPKTPAPPPPPLSSFELQDFSKTTADAEPHFVKMKMNGDGY